MRGKRVCFTRKCTRLHTREGCGWEIQLSQKIRIGCSRKITVLKIITITQNVKFNIHIRICLPVIYPYSPMIVPTLAHSSALPLAPLFASRSSACPPNLKPTSLPPLRPRPSGPSAVPRIPGVTRTTARAHARTFDLLAGGLVRVHHHDGEKAPSGCAIGVLST